MSPRPDPRRDASRSGGDAHALSPKAQWTDADHADTWATLRANYSLGANPYDPATTSAGAAYLRELHDRYARLVSLRLQRRSGAYEDHLATSAAADETRAYVAMLAPLIGDRATDGA